MSSEQHSVIIIINAGSSSIKVSVFSLASGGTPTLYLHAECSDIGGHNPHVTLKDADGETLSNTTFKSTEVTDHSAAYTKLREAMQSKISGFSPVAIGHRVVHGGAHYDQPVVITDEVKHNIAELTVLAPLHQPPALEGIAAVEEHAPDILQVAGFDTSFHLHREPLTQLTGLPYRYFEHGLKRFGFHGLSYEYIAKALREKAPTLADKRIIVAHLGNGASLCAMHHGKSINTTMSLTPLDGLPMGTRCGSLDPGLLLYLLSAGMSVDELRKLLYYDSGLKGLSGISNDMQELLNSTDEHAKQAIDFFVFRIAEEFSRMAVSLGGVDALVFTGGIGEHSSAIRERVCKHLEPLYGTAIDSAANNYHAPWRISRGGKCGVYVMPTDEEGMLAEHVWQIWRSRSDHTVQ